MREKEVKVDRKHRIHNKINPYSIFFGVALTIFSLVLLFVVLWGFMSTFKDYGALDSAPLALPNLYNNNKYGTGNEDYWAYGLFMNYEVVLNCLAYEPTIARYFLGWNLSEPVNLYLVNNFPEPGVGIWLWFIWNSIWQCFAGTVLPMMMCAIVGYTCAKYKYKFSGFVYSIVVFTMVLPVVGTQPVTIALLQRIRFYDDPVGFLIWNCNFASMYFMIFFAYYQGLSDSYFEAAEIDGASQFRCLTQIAIPLAKTIFSATFVVHFIDTWTNYGTSMVYLPSHPNLAYGIHYNTVVVTRFDSAQKMTSLYMMALPAAVFFAVFRKQLMGNISIGGIKE